MARWRTNVVDYEIKNLSPYKATKAETNYAHLAFHLALKKGKVKHGKHCAIIYDENENIVTSFVNKHCILPCGNLSSTHAEAGAIKMAKKENPDINLTKCKLMVIRANFHGCFTMSKPCIECYKTIEKSGIKTVIFSNEKSQKDKPEFDRIII